MAQMRSSTWSAEGKSSFLPKPEEFCMPDIENIEMLLNTDVPEELFQQLQQFETCKDVVVIQPDYNLPSSHTNFHATVEATVFTEAKFLYDCPENPTLVLKEISNTNKVKNSQPNLAKRKRGRPRKHPYNHEGTSNLPNPNVASPSSIHQTFDTPESKFSPAKVEKRKRGRPRIHPRHNVAMNNSEIHKGDGTNQKATTGSKKYCIIKNQSMKLTLKRI